MAKPPASSLKLSIPEVERLLQRFVEEGLRQKSVETRGTYQRALNEFLRFLAAHDGRQWRFRTEDVERYKTYLMEEKGLHQVSVSTYLTSIRRLCQFMVDTGMLTENPARGVKGNRRPSQHTRSVLTLEEVSKVLHALPANDLLDLRDRALIYAMLFCGLSEIELVRANREDLEITLLGTFLWIQGKGRSVKDQQVEVEPRVISVLEPYLIARGEVKPSDPLFPSHGKRSGGERLNTRSVRLRVSARLEAAGIVRDGITPHSLTHTAPLLWLSTGATTEEVRKRMRHGTLDTTLIYIRKQGLLFKSPEELKTLR